MNIKVDFGSEFKGNLSTSEGIFPIGDDGLYPYDMVGAALASCLHHTFLDILRKKRIEIESTTYEVQGKKRTQIPTHLETVHLNVVVKAKNEKGIRESFELAAKYCSVYYTIMQVASITYTLTITE